MTSYNVADVLIKYFAQFKEHKQLTFIASWDVTQDSKLANTVIIPADIVADREAKLVELTFYVKENQATAVQAKNNITRLMVDHFGSFEHRLFEYEEVKGQPVEVFIDLRLGEIIPQAFEGDNYIFTSNALVIISKKINNRRSNAWQIM